MRLRANRFTASQDGGAALELAIGFAVVLAIAAAALDLYTRIEADGLVGRAAAILAEYTALDPAPEQAEMQALTEALHSGVLGVPSDLAVTVSLVRKGTTGPNAPVAVVWSDKSFQVGDQAAEIAQSCARIVSGGGTVSLPTEVANGMQQGGAVVVSEACARLRREGSLSGQFFEDIYRLHVIPARDPAALPQAPA